MKKHLLFLFIILCFSCEESTIKKTRGQVIVEEINNLDRNSTKSQTKVNPTKETKVNYEVIRHDEISDRYFVVLDSNLVYNYELITQMICELSSQNDVTLNSDISFFSEIKWADYKDILFSNPDKKYPKEEYQKWLNSYYLGEFDFKNRVYRAYPVSQPESNKRKNRIIKECT